MSTALQKLKSNHSLYGVLCVLLATVGLSMKAIFIKLVYLADPTIDAISVLTLRFVMALPFFMFFLAHSQHKNSSATFSMMSFRQIGVIFLLGSVGFYVSAILDFSALVYISAGLERLILFMYPTFVVLISFIVRPKEISRATILALIICYSGILLIFAEQAPTANPGIIHGALMVFGAAIIFAVYTIASVQQIHRHGSVKFTTYAMIAATLATLVHAAMTHGMLIFAQSLHVYMLVLPMAIFSTVLPLLLMAEGIKSIGASSSSIISTSGPVITISLAIVLLGETFSGVQMIGSTMIMAGVFLVARYSQAQKS